MGEATGLCVPSQGGDIFMHPQHLTYANPADLKARPLTKLQKLSEVTTRTGLSADMERWEGKSYNCMQVLRAVKRFPGFPDPALRR